MDTTLTESGPFERVLTVRIPEEQLEAAKDRAARKISREIKIPGFRPGHARRSMVERAVGPERVRSEALEEALPEIVGEALEAAELRPAIVPSVVDTRETDDGIEVDVAVTLWPSIEGGDIDYRDRRVVVDQPEVTDDEIDAQIDAMRSQFAELEESPHPAQEGDFTLVNIDAMSGGDRVDEASAADYLYEVGSGSFIPGLDEPLLGSGPGDIKTVSAELPAGFGDHAGAAVELRILVKAVRRRKLPELTDEWVGDASEFETVAELRDSMAEAIESAKRAQLGSTLRSRILQDLLEEVDIAIPEPLLNAEMEEAAHRFAHQLENSGISVEQYLQITGQDQEAFVADLRSQSEQNLGTRILLDAIAEAEGIEVEAEELEFMIGRLAASTDQPPDEYAQQLVQSGQVNALAGDILRQKTLDRVAELADPVDGNGDPVIIETPGRDDHADDAPDDAGTAEEEEEEEG